MTTVDHSQQEHEVSERPPLLPAASSLRPTHVTSHLPPLKSQKSHKNNAPTSSRARSPFRRRGTTTRHEPPSYSGPGFPNSNTLQTFLTVTEVPHFGHSHLQTTGRSNDPSHSTIPGHDWRVRKTPIFSGLLAPFSIVLEVPGLTSKWYAKIDADGIVERFIDNPPILTAGLAISLACAVVANAAIILRFLEVLRPRASIALAIGGFVLHDIINLVALGTFGGIYGPKNDGLSLSASYWLVCASTITSTLVTISLVADYARTNNFRYAGSGLTQLQKGLVLSSMGLMLYLSLGSLIFVFVIGIDFITALYFSTATVLTVGFGDVVPTSPGGKVLVIFYAPIGIILVALVVSSARNSILETWQAALLARSKERRRRIAERRAQHKEFKQQDRALRKMMPRTFTFGPNFGAADDKNNDFAEALARMEHQAANPSSADKGGTATSISTTAASTFDPPPAAASEKVPTVTTGDPTIQDQITTLQNELLAAKRRTEEEFRHSEEHSRHEAITASRMKVALAASVFAAFWLLGAVAFTYAEQWSYGGALWFCYIAMITIGYGDYHPSTQLGRAIFVIWGLLGVAVLTILLAVVQDAFGGVLHRMLTNSTSRLFDRAERRARKKRKEKLKQKQEKEKEARKSSSTNRASEDVEASAASQGQKVLRRRKVQQRKSESDARHLQHQPNQAKTRERKSMEGCVDRPALGLHRQSSSAESHTPTEADLEAGATIRIPSFSLELPSVSDNTFEVHLPANAAARVEDALVSTPQKLALAALQTFNHSVRVMQLREPMIVKTMTEMPALRQYYNSRQHRNTPQEESGGMDAETALQKLQASIRQTANPEFEKVSKLVVAHLEFETQLRVLLEQFQGLKDRVEGFKEKQMERSRTLTVQSDQNQDEHRHHRRHESQ